MIKTKIKTNKMIKIALLSAIAFILMFLDFNIPLMPSFLKLDFSDIPALIAAFSFGPLSGIFCEFIKNLLIIIIKGSSTGFVGELANFLIGSSICFIAGIIYINNKTKKTALISLICGTIVMAIVGCFVNYFILLPFYQNAMNYPIEELIKISQFANPYIVSKLTLVLYAILPFNLIKGLLISIILVAIYKRISAVL